MRALSLLAAVPLILAAGLGPGRAALAARPMTEVQSAEMRTAKFLVDYCEGLNSEPEIRNEIVVSCYPRGLKLLKLKTAPLVLETCSNLGSTGYTMEAQACFLRMLEPLSRLRESEKPAILAQMQATLLLRGCMAAKEAGRRTACIDGAARRNAPLKQVQTACEAKDTLTDKVRCYETELTTRRRMSFEE